MAEVAIDVGYARPRLRLALGGDGVWCCFKEDEVTVFGFRVGQ